MRFLLLLLMLLPILTLSAKAPRCELCRKQIRGKYIVSNGKNYCSKRCYEKTLPNCASCGKKVKGEAYQYKGKTYCSIPCMKQVFPKCDRCGNPISGTYKVFESADGKTGKMCLHCSRLTRCFACELPAQTKNLPDGRHICRKCADQCLSPEEERALFKEVRAKLEELLGRKTRCRVKLYMVDYPELKKRSPHQSFSDTDIELGVCETKMSYRERNGKKEITGHECAVYILNNMPRGKFIDVAAHELAHHWQYHEYPFLRRDPLKIPEGFAEYAASLVNSAYGQEEYNRRKEKRRDFIYGAGFKFYRKLAEKRGLASIFDYMKLNSAE